MKQKKLVNLTLSKLKTFGLLKSRYKKWDSKPQTDRKYLQYIYIWIYIWEGTTILTLWNTFLYYSVIKRYMINLKNMNKIFESIVQGRRYVDDQ